MIEKRYKAIPEVASYKDTVTGEFLSPKFEEGFYKVLDLLNENVELKKQIRNTIEMLKMEKETAISKNEIIRLDFAINVLKELEE
jgi:hypothetical protein